MLDFEKFKLNLVVQISGLVSSPGVLEHGVGSMELPIAVSSDENGTALSSCHSELLLEEVGSLDAVAMHGGVDLLLVGLPRLIIIIILILITRLPCLLLSPWVRHTLAFAPSQVVGHDIYSLRQFVMLVMVLIVIRRVVMVTDIKYLVIGPDDLPN